MNAMYIDSYIRVPYKRHWLSNSPKKYKQKPFKDPAIIVTNKRKNRLIYNKFNADTLDTFCFHWPDMHSYVLVRVLEATIAILPVRSRVAFLYFNHAPLPNHPSPKALRKALQPVAANSNRIQGMFKNWKHTLTMEDDNSEEEEEEEVPTPVASIDTPPSTPKTYANVTLADVLSNEPNLHTGWIHAPCTVKCNPNRYDNHLIVVAKHAELKLTARCFTEKMMFMNLVKLKHGQLLQRDLDNETISSTAESTATLYEDSDTASEVIQQKKCRRLSESMVNISSEDMIQNLQRELEVQLETIYGLVEKLKRTKQDISSYSLQLFDLDRSLDRLMDSTLNIQFRPLKKELASVDRQLAGLVTEIHSDCQRITQLQERVSVLSAFLVGACQRYEQIKKRVRSHTWYPWLYTALAGLVLLVSILITYYCYHNKSIKEPSSFIKYNMYNNNI